MNWIGGQANHTGDCALHMKTVKLSLSSSLKVKVLVTQSSLTLCDPMDCSSPGSPVHGVLQIRILV